MIYSTALIAVLILTGIQPASASDRVAPEITSGRYYFEDGGAKLDGYKLKLHTAIAEAVRLSDACGCIITIKTPDIKVKTKRIPRATGDTKLSWAIPTTRADSTPLAIQEIKKYVIAYSNETGDELLIDVIDAATTDYIMPSLTAGVWSFKIATVDVNGLTSVWSDIVHKEI